LPLCLFGEQRKKEQILVVGLCIWLCHAITVSCSVHLLVALGQQSTSTWQKKNKKGITKTLVALIVSDSQTCLIQYNITFSGRIVLRDRIVLGFAL
jgi:hypothetical protein